MLSGNEPKLGCRSLGLDGLDRGAGGIWVISPQGKHLGTLVFPERSLNMVFGDADGKSLYVTARAGLYWIRLKIPDIRP